MAVIALIGISSRKATIVKVYAIYLAIDLIFGCFNSFSYALTLPDDQKIVAFILYGLAVILNIYFIFVFNSYADQLKREKSEEKDIAAAAAAV